MRRRLAPCRPAAQGPAGQGGRVVGHHGVRHPVRAGGAHWQATQDDGQPLLVGLQAAGALPVADQLHLALTDLWQVTLPLRLARMAGSEPDKTIHLSSFSIDPGDGP